MKVTSDAIKGDKISGQRRTSTPSETESYVFSSDISQLTSPKVVSGGGLITNNVGRRKSMRQTEGRFFPLMQ